MMITLGRGKFRNYPELMMITLVRNKMIITFRPNSAEVEDGDHFVVSRLNELV